MYYFSLIFIIALIFPAQGWAEVYLRGTVLSVDQERGEMVLLPVEFIATNDNNDSSVKELTPIAVRLPIRHRRHEEYRNRQFQCPVPGQQIRLRGEFDPESKLFLARDIRGCGYRGGPDPTGIRGRLGRDCDKDRRHRKHFGRRCGPKRHRPPFIPPEQKSEADTLNEGN